MKSDELIYLDTYVLQQNMRICLLKSSLVNLNVEKRNLHFMIYYDKSIEPIFLNQKTKLMTN